MSLLKISEDTLLSNLNKYNPWWENSRYSFQLLKKREYFKSFRELVLNQNIKRAVILMGPRRVGKTVILHQLIHDVLQKKIISRNGIFFVSIDNPIYNNISLEKFIELFQKKTNRSAKAKKLVIFDEIQYLKDWERHLKALVDHYPHIKFVASGSSAAALKRKSIESGAGRFTDFFLPPLTFKEFIDLSTTKKPKGIKKFNEALIDYINFGGYPEPIFNSAIQKNIKQFIGQDVIDKVLLRDLPALYGIQDTQELNNLLTVIAFNSGREINLESLSKNSQISKNTIQRYLTYLESAFLIKRVYRIDDSGKRFKRARNFKVYLTNPSMYSALFGEVKNTDSNIGNIIETAVFSQHFHIQNFAAKRIYYARWKKNNVEFEVDLVWTDERYSPKTLLEIKWSDRHINTINDALKGLLELAVKHKLKSVFTTSVAKHHTVQHTYKGNNIEIMFVPCSDFCYKIGKIFLEEGGINAELIKRM